MMGSSRIKTIRNLAFLLLTGSFLGLQGATLLAYTPY